jgi:hypothetical protein
LIPARISSRPVELGVARGNPPHAVRCEQRREAVVVVHHLRVDGIAAQRLHLDPVSDGLTT